MGSNCSKPENPPSLFDYDESNPNNKKQIKTYENSLQKTEKPSKNKPKAKGDESFDIKKVDTNNTERSFSVKEVRNLQDQNNKLGKDYDKTVKMCTDLALEKEVFIGKNITLENENKRLLERSYQLEKKSNDFEKKVQELLYEKEILLGKNSYLENDLKNMFERKDQIERKSNELERTIQGFLNKNNDIRRSEQRSEETINLLTTRIQETTVENNDKDLQIAKLEEQLQKSNKKIAKYKKKFGEAQQELKEAKEQFEGNKMRFCELKEQFEDIQMKFIENLKKLEKAKKKHKDQKHTIATLTQTQKDLELAKEELRISYKDLRKNLGLSTPGKTKAKATNGSSKEQNPSPYSYDMVINIDSLVSSKYGWTIERSESCSSSSSSQRAYSIIGLVGRENAGKTYILNKICGFDFPAGANVNTKGLSMKYANNRNLICLDSAGIGTPVYYYDEGLMKRFGVTKGTLRETKEVKHKMIDDRTLTDVFVNDFILDVCEVIIIVVGQLSQYDQKFIERVESRYQAKKKIIVVHNFANLFSVRDVERKIERDIVNVYETIERRIANTDVFEYIEKSADKLKENVLHLVLGVDWCESGKKFNEATFQYLRDILDTRVEKRNFDFLKELERFMEENYRLYFQFRQIPKKGFSLKTNKNKTEVRIETDGVFEVSNPVFNSLGNLITNPPYEVYERNDAFICLIELSNLKIDEGLKFSIDKKTEFACLIVSGVKNASEMANQENVKVVGTRNYGEIMCKIPLGLREGKIKVKENDFKYEKGILMVEVAKLEEFEEF